MCRTSRRKRRRLLSSSFSHIPIHTRNQGSHSSSHGGNHINNTVARINQDIDCRDLNIPNNNSNTQDQGSNLIALLTQSPGDPDSDSDGSESDTRSDIGYDHTRKFYESIDLPSLWLTGTTTCCHHLSREEYNNFKDFAGLYVDGQDIRLPSYSNIQNKFRYELLSHYCVQSRNKNRSLQITVFQCP